MLQGQMGRLVSTGLYLSGGQKRLGAVNTREGTLCGRDMYNVWYPCVKVQAERQQQQKDYVQQGLWTWKHFH